MNNGEIIETEKQAKASRKKSVLSNILAAFLLGGVTLGYGVVKVINLFRRKKKTEVNDDAEL